MEILQYRCIIYKLDFASARTDNLIPKSIYLISEKKRKPIEKFSLRFVLEAFVMRYGMSAIYKKVLIGNCIVHSTVSQDV